MLIFAPVLFSVPPLFVHVQGISNKDISGPEWTNRIALSYLELRQLHELKGFHKGFDHFQNTKPSRGLQYHAAAQIWL